MKSTLKKHISAMGLLGLLIMTVGCSEPLHDAADRGKVEKLRRMLKKGSDVNQLNIYGDTALHRAACKNKPVIARELIEYGANINARDAEGRTPLDVAILSGNEEVINVLQQYGATGKLLRDNGKTKKKSFLASLDTDGDGTVSEVEYAVSRMPEMRRKFKRLDTDNNGRLDLQELQPLKPQQ